MYGAKNSITKSVDFILNFENPCTDTDFVNIMPPMLLDLDYTIMSGPKVYTHESFTVST